MGIEWEMISDYSGKPTVKEEEEDDALDDRGQESTTEHGATEGNRIIWRGVGYPAKLGATDQAVK